MICHLTKGDSKAISEYNSFTTSAARPSTLQCASGPYYKYYYKPSYLYWPPIRFRQCDGLVCGQSGKCTPSRTHVIYRWAIVFRCTYHYCYFIGIQYLQFTEHLSCKCPECITDVDCTPPKTCDRHSLTCQCPAFGSCPHGYTWDRVQCKCALCSIRPCLDGFDFDRTICECVRYDIAAE